MSEQGPCDQIIEAYEKVCAAGDMLRVLVALTHYECEGPTGYDCTEHEPCIIGRALMGWEKAKKAGKA
jgi:hypothetical protein